MCDKHTRPSLKLQKCHLRNKADPKRSDGNLVRSQTCYSCNDKFNLYVYGCSSIATQMLQWNSLLSTRERTKFKKLLDLSYREVNKICDISATSISMMLNFYGYNIHFNIYISSVANHCRQMKSFITNNTVHFQ